MVRSAPASRRAIGRSAAVGSPTWASRSPTRRPSITSPVTVTVVTAGGSGPSVVTAYADGSRNGSTPSTVATVSGGATSLAGTTATTSRSARTSAGVPVRSAPGPASSSDQLVTAPSCSDWTSATVRSSGGRVGCRATTSGVGVVTGVSVGLGGGACAGEVLGASVGSALSGSDVQAAVRARTTSSAATRRGRPAGIVRTTGRRPPGFLAGPASAASLAG